MTEQRFIKMMRQYTVISGKFARSYAKQIGALLKLRKQALEGSRLSPSEQGEQMAQLVDMVKREYGRSDRSFKESDLD